MLKTSIKQISYNNGIIALLFVYVGMVYFSIAASNISLGLAIFSFIVGVSKNKVQLCFTKRKWLLYIAIIIPLVLTILSVIYSDNSIRGLKYIWIRLPILIVPFILIFVKFKSSDIKTGLLIFVVLTSIASIITLYNAIKYFNEDILFKTDFAHFITIIQHPYFGVYVLIALISILELNLIKHKVFKSVICTLLVFTIMLTTSRLTYMLFVVYSCYYLFKSLPKKWFFSFTVLGVVLAYVFLNTNPNIANKFKSTIEYKNSPRMQLWNNAIKVIEKQNAFIFGVGIGDYYLNKKDIYFAKGRDSGIVGLNPHSQLLEFYITNGFLGISVLILAIIVFFGSLRLQNKYAVFLFSIIFLFSLIESIFNRQIGVQLYCVLIPLSLNENFKKKR